MVGIWIGIALPSRRPNTIRSQTTASEARPYSRVLESLFSVPSDLQNPSDQFADLGVQILAIQEC